MGFRLGFDAGSVDTHEESNRQEAVNKNVAALEKGRLSLKKKGVILPNGTIIPGTNFTFAYSGNEREIREALSAFHGNDSSGPDTILDAPNIISQTTRLIQSVLVGKQNNMSILATAIREGEMDAALSFGPTGPWGAISAFENSNATMRPAIGLVFPCRNGDKSLVTDVGFSAGTPDPLPRQYLDLYLQGSAFLEATEGITYPRIALLSWGTERRKGWPNAKAARNMFEKLLNATVISGEIEERVINGSLFENGFVEPEHIHENAIDLVLTGAAMGNIFLKSSEATARSMNDKYREAIYSHWLLKLICGLFKQQFKNSLADYLPENPSNTMMPLLGLKNGVVGIGHSGAKPTVIEASVSRLAQLAASEYTRRFNEILVQRLLRIQNSGVIEENGF